MRRILISLVMTALFLGQGFSFAAALCRHGSAREHAIARESRDKAVASVAEAEEAAEMVVEKKGALSGSSSLHSIWAALPTSPRLADRTSDLRELEWPAADDLALKSEPTAPLLRPPLG